MGRRRPRGQQNNTIYMCPLSCQRGKQTAGLHCNLDLKNSFTGHMKLTMKHHRYALSSYYHIVGNGTWDGFILLVINSTLSFSKVLFKV